MSLWKSPIVYVGTALVLLIAALLSAPVVIDWNGYRASIEDYGRRLTGRQVTVVGDVSVHLFPWPRLRLEKVRIANVEGAMLPDMMRAEAVEARMLLGSLISGYVEVSDIRVEKPIVSFERLASGDGNWWFDPAIEGAASVDARRVSIDNLEVIDGTVFLSDSRRGGTAQLNDVNAVLNAQTLLGPWKARGEASYKDMPISIGLSTGRFRPGEPFGFGLRLSPVDSAGFVYSFEGHYNPEAETALSGVIEAAPYVSAEGKADSQAQMRPFALKSKVAFKDDRVLLDQIEIAPADPQPSSNLLTGSATIELKSRIAVHADLRSPKFDLDSVLGNEGRRILKSGSLLAALSGFLETVPDTLDGRLKLEVGNLLMGGQSLEGATLETELAPSGLTVRTLSATMPGQTKGSFSGMFLADRDSPQLAGDLVLDSADSRAFLSWLVPEWSEAIAGKWTGIRGKLALKARLDHAPGSLRLSEGAFTLDETQASGSLSIAGKDRGDTALDLVLDRIDLDRYVADGTLIGSPDDGFGEKLATVTAAVGALGDLQLTLSADSLLYHGVEARDVAAEVMARGDAIEIRALDIGNVGDARLEVAGALEPRGDGRQGSGSITVSAADPRPLLRLLGIVPPVTVDVPEPAWAAALGPLDATLKGDLAIGKDRANATLDLSGTAGGSQISAEAGYVGPPGDPVKGSLKIVG
ncbi:MAG TPA: AsmA family protein, partial [Aestuariivirgaceae bacterium]|nr:AsmA family protein [Aestuariivirgaceae bacterium]